MVILKTNGIKSKLLLLVKLCVICSLFSVITLAAKPLSFNEKVNQFKHFNKAHYQQLKKRQNSSFLWFRGQRLSLDGRELHSLLDDLGLLGEGYQLDALKQDKELWDFLLTKGIVNLLNISNAKYTIEEHLERLGSAMSEGSVDVLLLSVTPQFDQVSLLRKEIGRFKALTHIKWPVLDASFRPKLGQNHTKVADIRFILTHLGFLSEKEQRLSRLDAFDSVAINALKRFQEAHGLTIDGKLGPKTYASLNFSPKLRLLKLQINLQRWFSLPKELPEQYLLVNIPSFRLQLIDNGIETLRMKVIVGTKKHQTPQMVTYINRVTINPTWTPTFNIIKNELVPEYKKDFLSLKRKNFQLVKGYREEAVKTEVEEPNINIIKMMRTHRLVQAPGESNALGFYRFNIPNNQSIYLHDTPQKSLFNQTFRALSHGCVRLEKANVLSEYLLNQSQLELKPKVTRALESGKTTHLPLEKSLPVFITYHTVWVDSSGDVHFLPDIYDIDQHATPIAQFDATVSNPVITLSDNTPLD